VATSKTTNPAAKKASVSRKPLLAKEEKRLEAVAAEFPQNAVAVNYGRKLLKLKLGLRTTPAPRNGLSDEQVVNIRKLLDIEAKEKTESA
jgi:hypothetical protein